MNLYEVVWRLPGEWKLTGKVEAISHSEAADKAAKNAHKILEPYFEGMSHLKHGHVPTVHLLKSNSDKNYRVKMVFYSNGAKQEERFIKRVYKTRKRAEEMADSMRSIYIGAGSREHPESRVTAEVVEVGA
jgi:hypothetical protein